MNKPEIVYPQKDDGSINITKLSEYKLAVIISWGIHDHLIGIVVKRIGDYIISISGSEAWNNIGSYFNQDCRVKVLPPGTKVSFIVS